LSEKRKSLNLRIMSCRQEKRKEGKSHYVTRGNPPLETKKEESPPHKKKWTINTPLVLSHPGWEKRGKEKEGGEKSFSFLPRKEGEPVPFCLGEKE